MKVCLRNCIKLSNRYFDISKDFHSDTGCRNTIQMAQDSHRFPHKKLRNNNSSALKVLDCKKNSVSRFDTNSRIASI